MGHKVNIEPYKGSHLVCTQLSELVLAKYASLFHSIIVHGSIATDEVVYYSDFDGLVILRDENFQSRIFKSFIKESMKIIYQFDPLQHHGWFSIKKSDLRAYDQTVFPIELFEQSKVIFPYHEVQLEVKPAPDTDFKKPLRRLTASLQTKLDRNFYPKNQYQLKSFLSEIMLLPSLYFQATQGHGIFKRDSFKIVAGIVPEDAWSVIETSSYIRDNWGRLDGVHRKIITISRSINNKFAQRYLMPSIPKNFRILLDEGFFRSLQNLLNYCSKQVK